MVILWLLIRAKREDDFMSTSESERTLMEQLWTVVMPTRSGGEDGDGGQSVLFTSSRTPHPLPFRVFLQQAYPWVWYTQQVTKAQRWTHIKGTVIGFRTVMSLYRLIYVHIDVYAYIYVCNIYVHTYVCMCTCMHLYEMWDIERQTGKQTQSHCVNF